ncbi:MAG TPA: PilN domain-containing protein, partial [Rhodanobacteraceae bacterium]|nr:PilN domain-containing protein [Rhodanobacteraceae bacterium]
VRLAEIQRSLSVDEQRLALAEVRQASQDPRLRSVLCLPRAQVLSRRIKLPVAAENNLAQVLAFEMDRQTPFKADQVYADQRVASRDGALRSLGVEFAVVPKPVVDAALAALAPLDCQLDGVDGWQQAAGGTRLGFNFLPPAQRVRRHNVRLRINLALAAAAVLLLFFAMNLWVDNRRAALASMTAEVQTMQKEAGQVTALRKGLAESIEGASFLMRKKSTTPSMVALLADITHALPDDTYLERFSLDGNNQVTLGGQSDHAASLLEPVGKIKSLANASFQGVIQPDARTKKERFNIAATFLDQPVAAAKATSGKEQADAAETAN